VLEEPFTVCARLHSHSYEYESGYPCVGYSKHNFACIPIVAVYNMSTTEVQFALVQVVSVGALFLGYINE